MYLKNNIHILSVIAVMISLTLTVYLIYKFVKSKNIVYLISFITLIIISVLTIISNYNCATKLKNTNADYKSGTIQISSDIVEQGQFNFARVLNEINQEVLNEINEDINGSKLYRIIAQLKYQNDKLTFTTYQLQFIDTYGNVGMSFTNNDGTKVISYIVKPEDLNNGDNAYITSALSKIDTMNLADFLSKYMKSYQQQEITVLIEFEDIYGRTVDPTANDFIVKNNEIVALTDDYKSTDKTTRVYINNKYNIYI